MGFCFVFSEYPEGVLFLSLSEVVMMSESVRVCCLKNPALMLAMSKWSVTPSVSSVGCGELIGGLYLVFWLEFPKECVSTFFKTPES